LYKPTLYDLKFARML